MIYYYVNHLYYYINDLLTLRASFKINFQKVCVDLKDNGFGKFQIYYFSSK